MRAGDTPLIDACRHGRISDVTAILQSGANVNKPTADFRGASPLYVACRQGHLDVVSLLISAGASVNQATDNGATPLHVACENGQLDVVAALLSAGASINQACTDVGATPLHDACENGHLAIVTKLISAGAAIDQATTDGRDDEGTVGGPGPPRPSPSRGAHVVERGRELGDLRLQGLVPPLQLLDALRLLIPRQQLLLPLLEAVLDQPVVIRKLGHVIQKMLRIWSPRTLWGYLYKCSL